MSSKIPVDQTQYSSNLPPIDLPSAKLLQILLLGAVELAFQIVFQKGSGQRFIFRHDTDRFIPRSLKY
jgi:hypothetical protein